jgi:hypothetical protein
MLWRAHMIRCHGFKLVEFISIQLVKSFAVFCVLIVPLTAVADCSLRSRGKDGTDDCVSLSMAHLVLAIFLEVVHGGIDLGLFGDGPLCWKSFVLLDVRRELRTFVYIASAITLAPIACVALAYSIGSMSEMSSTAACTYSILWLTIGLVMASLLLLDLSKQHCKSAGLESDLLPSQGFLLRRWPESWQLHSGPWGTVCMYSSGGVHRPLFVINYPVDPVQDQSNSASDVTELMLHELASEFGWQRSLSERCRLLKLVPDWHALLIWALNMAAEGAEQTRGIDIIGSTVEDHPSFCQSFASFSRFAICSGQMQVTCQLPTQIFQHASSTTSLVFRRFPHTGPTEPPLPLRSSSANSMQNQITCKPQECSAPSSHSETPELGSQPIMATPRSTRESPLSPRPTPRGTRESPLSPMSAVQTERDPSDLIPSGRGGRGVLPLDSAAVLWTSARPGETSPSPQVPDAARSRSETPYPNSDDLGQRESVWLEL